LRSILRQDPNVIMVGEIRDRETAEIAMKAAQTGHLVLSTLHTNDSVSAVVRLLDLEIPPYLMAASLAGILAQRLVRKLCACRVQAPAGPEFLARMAEVNVSDPPENEYRPVGCAECEGTGFKGRIGVFELLVVDEPVRTAIRDGRIETIQEVARAQGMKPMRKDAIDKVRAGITTLGEALRVVPFENVQMVECPACQRSLTSAFRFCPHCGAHCDKQNGRRELTESHRESILLR
jgi:type II secretory ATPase GspE/PulE/Tfp pilus assembly ATPase PilB-like protein